MAYLRCQDVRFSRAGEAFLMTESKDVLIYSAFFTPAGGKCPARGALLLREVNGRIRLLEPAGGWVLGES